MVYNGWERDLDPYLDRDLGIHLLPKPGPLELESLVQQAVGQYTKER